MASVMRAMAEAASENIDLYCYCNQPYNRDMIACDECKGWFHQDCERISSTKAIDIFYCSTCRSKHPHLKIIFKSPPAPSSMRCSECNNCLSVPDCGECYRCKIENGRCIKVNCDNDGKKNENCLKKDQRNEEEIVDEDEQVSDLSQNTTVDVEEGKSDEEESQRGEKLNVENKDELYKNLLSIYDGMQCLGIRCVNVARLNSKYCSDECGRRLARERINRYLKKGVEQFWNVDPVATSQAREEERRMNEELASIKSEKANLDHWFTVTNAFIQGINALVGAEEPPIESSDYVVQCTVCNEDYGSDVLANHVKMCVAKQQKENTFGTNQKAEHIPENVLCEEYNEMISTYCKRLRVICLEHSNEDPCEEKKVCGYPLVWNRGGSSTIESVFTDIEEFHTGDICTVSREKCPRHTGWITYLLGNIDSRRLSCDLREKYLIEENNKRLPVGDAILLMNNQTEYHQPLEQIIDRYKTEAKKASDKVRGTVL